MLNSVMLILSSKINSEVENLDIVIKSLGSTRQLMLTEPRPEFVKSMATDLHSYFNGIEGIFKSIAKDVDKSEPGGNDSHSQLLKQMCLELDTRPAVIPKSKSDHLQELMKFRHAFRHIYGHILKPARIMELADSAIAEHQSVKDMLKVFNDFLKEAGKALSEPKPGKHDLSYPSRLK